METFLMSGSFDPYHKWLGISPADQPANHYRLLGISNFEDDADVIEAGADQRMLLLRSHQSGKHATHSQKLLNEISKAKITLLDPQRRAAYDAQLRAAASAPAKQAEAPAPRQRAPKQRVPVAAAAAPVAQPAARLEPLPPLTQDAFANSPTFHPQPVQPQATPQRVWTGAPRRRKSIFTSAAMLAIGAVTGVLFLGVMIVFAVIFAVTYERENATGVAMGTPTSPFSSKKAEERSTTDRIPVFERETEEPSPKPDPPAAVTPSPIPEPAPDNDVAMITSRVTIPANRRDGYSVGPLAAGQSIKLRYVSGRWKSWGRIPEIVPDNTKGKYGNKCRMAIVDFASNENVLLLCPEGTQSNPYIFTAPKNIQNLVLRINDLDGDWNNPGKVIYEVAAPGVGKPDNITGAPPASAGGNSILAAFTGNSTQVATLAPGLLMQEFAAVPNQSHSKGAPVSEFVEQKSEPQVIRSVGKWHYDQNHNAVASGYLKIDKPGEYQFNSNNFYDRNSLWLGGQKVCGFRDGEGKIIKVQLPAGYIRLQSIGYIAARGSVKVQWIPPGASSLSPIPDSLIFHLPGEPVIENRGDATPATDSKLADLRPISKISARPLVVGDPSKPKDWKQIPQELSGGVARIFDQGFNKYMGRVEFEITAPGMIYAIGHFKDQGSGGAWQKERWLPADFKRNGWTELQEKLVTQDGREYTVYGKHHQPAQSFKLRVNKYMPPFVICRKAGN